MRLENGKGELPPASTSRYEGPRVLDEAIMEKMIQDAIQDTKVSGDTLFDTVSAKLSKVDENIRYPDKAGGCFIKGTRVYTKEGRKPIEEVQVGDYVLSSPEDGSGQPEYKRVLKTIAHEPQPISESALAKKDGNGATRWIWWSPRATVLSGWKGLAGHVRTYSNLVNACVRGMVISPW